MVATLVRNTCGNRDVVLEAGVGRAAEAEVFKRVIRPGGERPEIQQAGEVLEVVGVDVAVASSVENADGIVESVVEHRPQAIKPMSRLRPKLLKNNDARE